MKEASPNRVDTILSMLSLGKTPEEIDYALGQYARGLERGNLSEKNVYQALKNYPGIKTIYICSKYKKQDHKGRDIFIELEKPLSNEHVKRIFIQVKSSQGGIDNFIRETCERENIPTNEVEKWLVDNNLIILNGRLSSSLIVQHFLSQLENIKKRKSPPFIK